LYSHGGSVRALCYFASGDCSPYAATRLASPESTRPVLMVYFVVVYLLAQEGSLDPRSRRRAGRIMPVDRSGLQT
jgi:hypothetical protein